MTKSSQSRFDNALFAFIIFAVIGYLIAVTFLPIPHQNVQTAADTKQCLQLVLVGLVGFKWGSSQSSQKKDQTIQELKENKELEVESSMPV